MRDRQARDGQAVPGEPVQRAVLRGFSLLGDGAIAPLLRLTPGIAEVPWPLDAKELANPVAWTATAELAHRRGARSAA